MDKPLSSLDWSLLQAFLAVAETGSLSAAARATGMSQPTLGRQVNALEEVLGVELFRRHPRGLALSETGAAMLPAARQMQEAAARLSLTAAGQDTALTGAVRIAASTVVAHHVLPPMLASLRAAEPGISIDLVASDQSENLLFREADIAVRMYRPTQLDMVTHHVTDLCMGIFAATSYLDRVGRPETLDQLLALDWVGYDRSALMIRGMTEAGWPVDRDFFATRTDDQAAHWQLVRAGCGVGITQRGIGEAEPRVERLLPEIAMPSIPVWLTVHQALRQTPRIARVWELLSAGFSAIS